MKKFKVLIFLLIIWYGQSYKIGYELEFKCDLLSDADYDPNNMPTLYNNNGDKIELDIEKRGTTTTLTKMGTYVEIFRSSSWWTMEISYFATDNDIPSALQIINTELALFKTNTLDPIPYDTYKFAGNIKRSSDGKLLPIGTKFILITKDCLEGDEPTEIYIQLNINYNIEKYITKLETLIDPIVSNAFLLEDKEITYNDRLTSTSTTEKLYTIMLDNYQLFLFLVKKAGLLHFSSTIYNVMMTDETHPKEHDENKYLLYWFIVNSLRQPIGNSGSFKNSFYIMPKTLIKLWGNIKEEINYIIKTKDKKSFFKKDSVKEQSSNPSITILNTLLADPNINDPDYFKQGAITTEKTKFINLFKKGEIIGEWRDLTGLLQIIANGLTLSIKTSHKDLNKFLSPVE